MPIPSAPTVPSTPVPIQLDGLLEIHRSAQLWARLAVAASLFTALVLLGLAWTGRVPWALAIPFFLAPLIPIATQTRLEEMRRKVEEQVRETRRVDPGAEGQD